MARLNWGMIGGGEGSQIGPVHRISSALDGRFDLKAGALDADAAKGRDFAMRLDVAEDRAYGNWQEKKPG
jgi:predicted dehydrogenase